MNLYEKFKNQGKNRAESIKITCKKYNKKYYKNRKIKCILYLIIVFFSFLIFNSFFIFCIFMDLTYVLYVSHVSAVTMAIIYTIFIVILSFHDRYFCFVWNAAKFI